MDVSLWLSYSRGAQTTSVLPAYTSQSRYIRVYFAIRRVFRQCQVSERNEQEGSYLEHSGLSGCSVTSSGFYMAFLASTIYFTLSNFSSSFAINGNEQ